MTRAAPAAVEHCANCGHAAADHMEMITATDPPMQGIVPCRQRCIIEDKPCMCDGWYVVDDDGPGPKEGRKAE